MEEWDSNHLPLKLIGIHKDTTSEMELIMEKEKLIVELNGALANIKTLNGMLPICASCKKIRDDDGYWEQIESYIQEHSSAVFSHSLCPECLEKYYPEETNSLRGLKKK